MERTRKDYGTGRVWDHPGECLDGSLFTDSSVWFGVKMKKVMGLYGTGKHLPVPTDAMRRIVATSSYPTTKLT